MNENKHAIPRPESPWVRLRQLSVWYRNTPAIRDITLDFPARAITAILGPSGAGKSTLLMAINRLTDLIAGCHVEGIVEFEGANLLAKSVDTTRLRRQVGMVFQKPILFPFSIYQNLELPLRELGKGRRAQLLELMENVLREVGLWDELKDRLHRPAWELSGGQQQRLCLARCLLTQPKVLLLDEPCSSLDPLSTETIEQLLHRMRSHYTIVLVTHHLAQARRLADSVALLWRFADGGRVVEHANREDFFQRPRETLTAQYLNGSLG